MQIEPIWHAPARSPAERRQVMSDPADVVPPLDVRLDEALTEHERRFPAEPPDRQPVHTMYGGAHLYKPGTPDKLGSLALRFLDQYGPTPDAFGDAMGMPADLGLRESVHSRVRDKLAVEPIEDFRLDFEDGYGIRADEEEDGHARSAGAAVAAAAADGVLPSFTGIRVKALNREFHHRTRRTVRLFLEQLSEGMGEVPNGFVVALPKVVVPEQVAACARMLDEIEADVGLPEGSVGIEIIIETPQSIFGVDGSVAVPALVEAAGGRARSAHFGPYDYTALLSITAAHQSVTHATCEAALRVLQVSLAGTGLRISDGATAEIPMPLHRAGPDEPLSEAQETENRDAVHAAWRVHYHNVRRSLVNGIYQSWDLHPGHLLPRYAAVYTFFLEARNDAALRLARFLEEAARATLVAGRFDDAATGQGLLNFFLRGRNCGALSEEEVMALTGLTVQELASRSFQKILELRRS
jgi:citrate lyase beta subunit